MKLNWQEVDTLLLDMDGTLLDLHFDNYFWLEHLPKRYAEIHHIEPKHAFDELEQRFLAKRGSLSWYCLEHWSQELQVDIVALKIEVQEKIALRPYAIEFLQYAKQLGKQTILITNAHRDSLNLKMQKTGLDQHLDIIASTHDYGLPKEDVRLWKALQEQYPYQVERTLMVDDGEHILDSAAQFGIKHLLTLLQPDSQKKALQQAQRHPAILHFNEVLPDV